MAKNSSRGQDWEALRLAVLNRDGWTCVYCGKGLVGSDAQADHLQPKSEGGADALWNLVASCALDNQRKGARVLQRTPYFNPTWLSSLY